MTSESARSSPNLLALLLMSPYHHPARHHFSSSSSSSSSQLGFLLDAYALYLSAGVMLDGYIPPMAYSRSVSRQ